MSDAQMKAALRYVFWLITAIAIVAVTVALASLIVFLAPDDPNVAAASMQQQILEPKLESMVRSHVRAK